MQEVTAGIDIGGIDTEIGIISDQGKIYKKAIIITSAFREVNDFISECAKIITDMSHGLKLIGVGIAAPNGNPYKGTIENPVNLSWNGIIPFVELMKVHIDLPIALTNDAKAAAIGEKLYGGAKGMNNFIFITLGMGLGSGIYTHGHLLTGQQGLAGEMGHMIVEEDGRVCNTKRKGCLEAYASVTGLRRTVFSLLSRSDQESELKKFSFEGLTGEKIALAATNKDAIALEAFEYTGKILGRALANAASLFDPEAIFLGGGLARAGDLILNPTREHFNQNVFPAFEGKIQILISELLNENGGILGASALAWEKYHRQISK